MHFSAPTIRTSWHDIRSSYLSLSVMLDALTSWVNLEILASERGFGGSYLLA